MAGKRKRSQNFTVEEKQKLIKLIIWCKDIILNKNTDGSTNEAKANAWMEVTDTFNSTGNIHRTKESLMKAWEKLKSESKVYYSNCKSNSKCSNGGSIGFQVDHILEQVCSVLGNGHSGIISVADKDSDTETTCSKLICRSDQGSPFDHKLEIQCDIIEVPLQAPSVISEDPSNYKENITPQIKKETTPAWSDIRLPFTVHSMPQSKERCEAISMVCRCQKLNGLKENVEELKKQLLRNEIKFKNRLYDIQIETTTKDLEIKNELLAQIKGGRLAMALQTLYGIQNDE